MSVSLSLSLTRMCVWLCFRHCTQGLAELRAENEHLKKQIGQYDQVIRKANGDKQVLQRDLERYNIVLLAYSSFMCNVAVYYRMCHCVLVISP